MKIIKITVASIVAIVLVAGIFLFKGELAPKEVDAKYTSDTSQFFTMRNGYFDYLHGKVSNSFTRNGL